MSRVALVLVVIAGGFTAGLAHKRLPAVRVAPAWLADTSLSTVARANRSMERLPLPRRVKASQPWAKARHDPAPAGKRVLRGVASVAHLNWPALARCESGGNPHAVDPTGVYFGLYQANQVTWDGVWRRHDRPDLVGVRPNTVAPALQQLFAELLFTERGREPWPTCGRSL